MQYTGSKYHGSYVNGRMEGKCEYEFPALLGTTYEGGIQDGNFHGDGKMYLANALAYHGKFENGLSKEGKYVFLDGLDCDINAKWDYCDPDVNRMFAVELKHGLNPAGRCLLSNLVPPREIPEGMHDSGDGFYDPKKRTLFTYNMKFLRNTDDEEHNWIVNKCRKAVPPETSGQKQNKE